MSERRFRSKEERIAELEKKIQFHKDKIAILEDRKKQLETPRLSAAQIIKAAKARGLTTEEIIKKLGI